MTVLDKTEIQKALKQWPAWTYANKTLHKTFHFNHFHETMAFVNAVAWIAHQQNHHPDISLSYKVCNISYSTHEVQGVTQRDLNAIIKVENLFSSKEPS